ncbi:MAG: EAL domain-containing protein [Spirochaetaceae bacterium]|nr:EAL domain-containing protein [Spirochaetaceae bacterium]
MKKDKLLFSGNRMNKILNNLSLGKQPSLVAFVSLIVLFFVLEFLITVVARSEAVIVLFGNEVPVTTFTGVVSLLENICIIFLAVFYKKRGFVTTLIILGIQFPIILVSFFVRHTNASIPGFFTNISMICVVLIIFVNNSIIGKYQEKIRQQAVTDTLTGLPNRFACTELISDFVKSKTNFTVISVDLNGFKSINDTMGHEVGNKILVEIASRWKALADSRRTKTVDFVARIGGDEFAIVSLGYDDNNDIIETINAYRNELEKIITIDDCDHYITAAFGYAKYPTDANVGAPLLSCADAAVHAVKRQGLSNCILRFTPAFWEPERYIEMERKIRTALKNDSIFFYLQPQYDMDHKLRGFEALARMKDAVGAFISPADFIPVAEKTGLIDRVDICVFRQAVAFLADVIEKGNSDITVSFNVSVRHMMKNGFIEEIKDVIKSSGVPANRLELEITESIMVDSAEKALRRINEIKALGIKVAIDDFGTGYSSLNYLNKLPSDMLKIDKSFIDVMNTSESSKQYVASIVSIGHILNLKVISEGVEQPEQLETLRKMGCDYIQGFIWGKPIPPEEAVKLV